MILRDGGGRKWTSVLGVSVFSEAPSHVPALAAWGGGSAGGTAGDEAVPGEEDDGVGGIG